MRSHPVKRVVSGALAAASVITVVTMAQPTATAAPIPVLQAPPTGSDALAKYRDLAGQAEKLNEDLLKAQDDLTAKQGQLDKANADVTAAKDAGAQATEAKQKYQTQVDKFAGASFTSGVQLNKLSALLAGTSTQDFLDRSAALEVIATDKNAAMDNLSGAAEKAAAAEKSATDAAKRAQDARDAAAKLASDIEGKKKNLQDADRPDRGAEQERSAPPTRPRRRTPAARRRPSRRPPRRRRRRSTRR